MQIKLFSITTVIACVATVAQGFPILECQPVFDQQVQAIKADPQVQDFLDGFINLVSADMESADAGATFDQKLEQVKADPSVKDGLDYFTNLIGQKIEEQNARVPSDDTPLPPS